MSTSSAQPQSSQAQSSQQTMAADFIKLDQFLKVTDVARSGGEAKLIIRSGEVSVNGEMELRRGRKLYDQDVVTVDETSFTVHISTAEEIAEEIAEDLS